MKILSIIFALLCHLFTSTQQTMVPVITSDNILCIIPKQHLKESATLYKIFLTEKQTNPTNTLCTTRVSTISSQELHLVSNALKTKNLSHYFDSLRSAQQQTLLTAAGKCARTDTDEIVPKLNVKSLTAKLLPLYLGVELSNTLISPLLPMDNLITDLKHTIIGSPMPQSTTNNIVSFNDYAIISGRGGCLLHLPLCLKTKNSPCCFQTIPVSIPNYRLPDNTTITLEYKEKRDDHPIQYLVTHHNENNVLHSNKKNIVMVSDKKINFCTTIEHPDENVIMELSCFCPNGHYFASVSNNSLQDDVNVILNNSSLLLTQLGTKADGSDCSHLFLNITGNVLSVCFNKASTVLAVGTTNGTYLFFTHNGKCIQHLLNSKTPLSTRVLFNNAGNNFFTLLTKRHEKPSKNLALIIWNTDGFSPRKTIFLRGTFATDLMYNTRYNMIIALTTQPDNFSPTFPLNILFFDENTGEQVHEICYSFPKYHIGSSFCTFNQDQTLLLVSNVAHKNVYLHDMRTKECVKTIRLGNSQKIRSLGFAHNDRCIISVLKNKTYIESTLYDEETAHSLEWIHSSPDVIQRYFLHRLHRIMKSGQLTPSHQELDSLPQGVKYLLEKYTRR